MEVKFIGQGFNIEENSSVAQELIIALNNKSYNTFKCLVAFATKAGVTRLTPHVLNSKEYIKNFRIVVGIDGGVTTKEALEALLEWNVEVYIYNFKPDNIIFHPKIYLFQGEDLGITIVGSNNLTLTGLVSNVESSILLEYNPKEEKGINFLSEINEYFQPLLSGNHPNLKLLTQDLIDKLKRGNKIPNEEEVREGYKAKKKDRTPNPEKDELDKLFPRVEIQKPPEGFVIPKKPVAPVAPVTSVVPIIPVTSTVPITPVTQPIVTPSGWTYNDNSIVLVAEIGGPSRWKQISFAKRNFETFFELPITVGSSGNISLKYINTDGTLNVNIEQITSAKVKASRNFNLEPEKVRECNIAYDRTNRPIIFFIKISSTEFIYHFETNGTQLYSELEQVLVIASRGLKRIEVTLDVLRQSCPSLSI
jgi:HKD family nuclease